MIKFIIKRLIALIPVILGVSLLVFFILDLAPGDPAKTILGEQARPEDIEALRAAVAQVRTNLIAQINTEVQKIYNADADLKQQMLDAGSPATITSLDDIKTLKTAMQQVRANVLSSAISATNDFLEILATFPDFFDYPASISTEQQLRKVVADFQNDDTLVLIFEMYGASMDMFTLPVTMLDTLDAVISLVGTAITAVEALDAAERTLKTANDRLSELKGVIGDLATAKSAVEKVKPYIGQILEAQETIALLKDTVLPLLGKVEEGLTQLEDGMAQMEEKNDQLSLLISVMQAFCKTVKPANDAFVNQTWNTPDVLDPATDPDYERLTLLADGMEQKNHAAKDVLHVTETVVKLKMDMYDVTVQYKAEVVDPTKTDSEETVALATKTFVVTLTKGATPADVLAEIAAKIDEDAILDAWAISADNYNRSTSQLPEALTEDATYTISYAPKQLTVTFAEGYEAGTPAVQVPYGYRMTLPVLTGNDAREYTYKVNDLVNLDQGTVVTITEDTVISREEGAASAKQYLTDLVINTTPGMDALIKNILQNQALNRGQAISIRVPGKEQVTVEPAPDGQSTTITAKPFGSRVGNKNWIAATALIDGVEVTMVDGVYVETVKPGFDKVVVNYELALTAAALGITDEQLLATMNIPYELVGDYKLQKTRLDALSANRMMNLLTQVNAQDIVIEDPSKMTLKEALGKVEDLNEVLELGLGAESVAAAKRLWAMIPDAGYLGLYYTLQQYNEQGMPHYYRNEQTYISQIVELNDIMTTLTEDPGFTRLIPEDKMDSFQTIHEVLEEAAELAEPGNGVNTDLVNVSSPYLNTLLAALSAAAENAQLTKYTQVPDEMVWTAAVEQPGPSKRTVTMTVNWSGVETSATKNVNFGAELTYAELTAWAQEMVKELGLGDEIAVYYTESYSFEGNQTAIQNLELSAKWELKEYAVMVEGEEVGKVTYEDRDFTLAAHTDPKFQYRYYINGELYSAGTHTLTLAQFKALTEGKLEITRETINLVENALIKFVDNMKGAAVLTKDADGKYAIVLRVDPATVKDDAMNLAIGLFVAEYKYMELDGEEFYTGKYHLQAVVDMLLNSGVGTDSLLELIDSEGKIATNLTLEAGTEVLNTEKPSYMDNLGGVVLESTMALGAEAADTTETKLYVTLAGEVDQMKTIRKGLQKAKDLGATFICNDGRLTVDVNLPDQAYGAYLAALSMVGQVDVNDVNAVNAQIAIGYLQNLLNPLLGDDVTVETYENTLKKLGKEVDLSRVARYFNLVKQYYDPDSITYEEDTAVLSLENVSINAIVAKLQSIVDEVELPEDLSVDLSKLIYEYDDPATADDDETAGLSATAAVRVNNLSTDYAAMFLDIRADGILNKFGMWTEAELIANADDFAGVSVVVLLNDVAGDLNFNTKTVLDLNGKTINGNVTGGENANLIVIDSAYEQAVPGGVTGTVSGAVSILEGKYASDVSAFLDNGYVQSDDGVVSNKLYSVTADDNGNLTIALNATPSDIKELASKKGLMELAIEMVAGLALNNYNKASMYIENGKVLHIALNDIVGLYASKNKLDAAIDTGLSWISASDLTDILNMIVADLTDFAALEEALLGDGKIVSYKFGTSNWEVKIEHVTDGDYLTVNLGASDDIQEITADVVVEGSLKGEMAQLAGALKDTVTVDVDVKVDDIVRDENSVINLHGSLKGVVEMDFTDDANYIIAMAVLLADGADAELKAKLVTGIEQFYEKTSLYDLEQIFKNLTVNQICDCVRNHPWGKEFATLVDGLALKAETKQTIKANIDSTEMGYNRVVDAASVALRFLSNRDLLETFTESGLTLAAYEKTDSVSNYFGFSRSARFAGIRNLFRDYKLDYDLDISRVSIKLRLFLDHVHTYKEIVDDQYLKEEATCLKQAVYWKSCSVCGKASDTEFFSYGELAEHKFTVEDPSEKYLKEAATCTKQAEYWKSCSVCGKASDTETFFYGDLEPHQFTAEVPTADYLKAPATCTKQAEYFKSCSVCGKASDTETFFYGDLEPHQFTAEVPTADYLKTPATCTKQAEYFKSCSVCGKASDTETFFYGDLEPHQFTAEVPTADYLKAPATCTKQAEYFKSCSECGAASTTETFFYGELAEHKFTEEVATDEYLKAPATCTKQAEYFKSCSECGAASTTETFFYGALGDHSFTAEVPTADYLKAPATCTKQAEYFKSCSECGAASTTETFFYGELAEHKFTEEVATDEYLKAPATCTKQAEYFKSCSECGAASTTETFFYGALGDHILTNVPANPATATANGNKEHWTCDCCGKLFADAAGTAEITAQDVVIAALPTIGVPNMPVGGSVYGFLVDANAKILFVDTVKTGMNVDTFKSLLTAAVANDADNKPEITVQGTYNNGGTALICTTSKVTLIAENVDGVKVTTIYDVVVMGDTNCNGKIDSGDAVKIDQHYRGLQKLTGLVFLAADTNRNGRLESGDAVKIMVKYQNSADYVSALKK